MTASEGELRLYTLHEVAEILRLPYAFVSDQIHRGEWSHYRFSARNRRMSAEHIREVLEDHHETAVPAGPTSRSAAHLRRRRMTALLRGA